MEREPSETEKADTDPAQLDGSANYTLEFNKGGIDAETVGAYLQHLEINLACEICSNNDWGVVANLGKMTPVIVSQNSQDPEENYALPVVLLSCTRCGNIKTLSRAMIDNWLRTRDRSGE